MQFKANLALGNQGKQIDIHTRKRFADLETVVNNGIEFGQPKGATPFSATAENPGSVGNIKGTWVTVTTPSEPDTDFVIDHNLGTVPVGTDIKQKSAPADVYIGTQPATDSQITLKSTAANAKLSLFIH
jgi:hypothetical protein